MTKLEEYENDRDEAALQEITRLAAVFGDADINPKCIVEFGNFMADWSRQFTLEEVDSDLKAIAMQNIDANMELIKLQSQLLTVKREGFDAAVRELKEKQVGFVSTDAFWDEHGTGVVGWLETRRDEVLK